MSGPLIGKPASFVFPRVLMFPKTKSRETTGSGLSGNKTICFNRSIATCSMFVYIKLNTYCTLPSRFKFLNIELPLLWCAWKNKWLCISVLLPWSRAVVVYKVWNIWPGVSVWTDSGYGLNYRFYFTGSQGTCWQKENSWEVACLAFVTKKYNP